MTVPVHYLNMSSFLTAHGIENDIIEVKERSRFIDRPSEYYDNILINRIKKKPYKYIGLSCYTTDYNTTLKLIKKIKKALPDVKIIIGGPHVTLRPKDPFLSKAPVDVVIIGEGEYPLLNILKKKKSLHEIDGVCFKEKGKIIINKPQCLAKDLTHIPLPAYDKIDMDFYLRPDNMGIRFLVTSCIHIFTSLGCPFNCVFCANKGLYKAQNSSKIVRCKSVDQVINEIKFLKKKYGMEAFYIQDDTLTLDKKRVKEICRRLKKEKLNMLWGAETRVNLINEDLIVKMKYAGCRQLDFGVEAATQEALDRIKKKITIEETKKAFALCRKHGIRTGANIMLNIPGETERDVKEIKGYLKSLKADVYYIALTVPFIGTEAYDKYVKPRLTLKEYSLFENPFLYGTIIDKRFRLAKHNLPLEKIIAKMRVSLVLPKTILDFPLRMFYIKYLWKSKYKLAILYSMAKNFIAVFNLGLEFLFRKKSPQ